MPKPTLLQTVFNQPSQKYYGYTTPLPSQQKEFHSFTPEYHRFYGNVSDEAARSGGDSSVLSRHSGQSGGQWNSHSEGVGRGDHGHMASNSRQAGESSNSLAAGSRAVPSKVQLDGGPTIPTTLRRGRPQLVRTETTPRAPTLPYAQSHGGRDRRGLSGMTPSSSGRSHHTPKTQRFHRRTTGADKYEDTSNSDDDSSDTSTASLDPMATGDDETVYYTPMSSPGDLPVSAAASPTAAPTLLPALLGRSRAGRLSASGHSPVTSAPPGHRTPNYFEPRLHPALSPAPPSSSSSSAPTPPLPAPPRVAVRTMLATLPSTSSLASASTSTLSPDGSLFSDASSSTRATSSAPASDRSGGSSDPKSAPASPRSVVLSTNSSRTSRAKAPEIPGPHRSATIAHTSSARRPTASDSDWSKDVLWLVPPTRDQTPLNSHNQRQHRRQSFPIRGHIPMDAMVASVVGTTESPAPPPLPSRTRHKHQPQMHGEHHVHRVEKRMSALWEEDEEGAGNPTGGAAHAYTKPRQKPITRARTLSAPMAPPVRRHPLGSSRSSESSSTSDHSLPHSRSSTIHSVAPTHSSLRTSNSATSHQTVDLSSALSVSSGANTPMGYTSLTLPRAAYTPSKSPMKITSNVDITRSGLAQTTMSTISIVKNGAAALRFSKAGASTPSLNSTLSSKSGALRRLSFSRQFSSSSRSSSSTTLSETNQNKRASGVPEHLRHDTPNLLIFGSHTPPPSRVGGQQLLIQVWAVGMDGVDARLVAEKAVKSDGFGFVPGRSFVGRVVEVGYEVKGVHKGEVVIGLLDVRKSGALAEFFVVDRRRVYRAPHANPPLSIEQLAFLPLAALPAHRAVRTLAIPSPHRLQHAPRQYDADGDVFSPSGPRSCHALVLWGHDGIGGAVVQMLTARGVRVTAQVPPDVKGAEDRALMWGAEEVVVDAVIEAVGVLHDGEFEIVVDTVGGKEVWEACRRVLGVNGQFTTLVGDSTSAIPSAQTNFRSSLRSLSPWKTNKDRKEIAYIWVSAFADVDAEGADTRDTLEAVVKLVEQGAVRPILPLASSASGGERVVPFERGAEVFGFGASAILREGGTAVVRISS